jgi:hypothetical protein
MAGVALLPRWRVLRRLADGLHVVVTSRATAEDRVVIHLGERKPRRIPVAIAAKVGGQHVIRGLRLSLDTTTGDVAGTAFRGSAGEDTADVARLAVEQAVSPRQVEARREVIEASRPLLRRYEAGCRGKSQQAAEK